MSTLGARVKLVRTKNNLKQEEFADSLSVSRSFISRIETDKENASDTVIKLISLQYNVSYRWLREGNGEYSINKDTDYFGRGYEQEFKSGLLSSFQKLINELELMNSASLFISASAIITECTELLKLYIDNKNIGIVVFDQLTNIFIEIPSLLSKCEKEDNIYSIELMFNAILNEITETIIGLKNDYIDRKSV